MPRAVIVCLLAALAMVLPGPAAEAGKKNDTLVWATDRENPIADTNFLNTRENFIFSFLIFDRLVLLDQSYRPQGLLATSWRWVDNLTLDFDLRPGVKFHNGKTMDADDVVYSLAFVVDPKNGAFSRSYLTWIKSVEKTGELKIRIHLLRPFPAALTFLAGAGIVVPKGHYDNAPLKGDGKRDYGAVTPVGTGPYKLAEIKPGELVRLVKFDGYFKDGPKIQPVIGTLLFRTIKDQNTRLAEVMTGNVDWIWDVPPELATKVKGNPNVVVDNAKTMRFAYLAFDVRGTSANKVFMDKRVREAVAHAINRESLVKNLVGPPSELIHSACHPDQFACTQNVPKYAYDPARSKQLLAEAGLASGFDVEIASYREREHAEAIIGDLAKVGIRAKLTFMQYSAMVPAIHRGQLTLVHSTWGSGSVPDVTASAGHFFTGSPDDMAKDAEVMRMIAAADSEVDPAKRAALWQQALARISGELLWLPLFTYSKYYIYTRDLDFRPTSDELPQFWNVKWK